MIIRYSENNFGGYWRLTPEDWHWLSANGWLVDTDEHTAVCKAESLEAAILDFERITYLRADEIGCTCCGQPHRFEALECEVCNDLTAFAAAFGWPVARQYTRCSKMVCPTCYGDEAWCRDCDIMLSADMPHTRCDACHEQWMASK